MKTIQTALLLAFGFALGACRQSGEPHAGGTEPAAPASSIWARAVPAAAVEARQTETVRRRMTEHFAKATDMKTAVIKGDLWGVHRAAAWLAEDERSARLRPDWQPFLMEMQLAASSAKGVTDTGAAAEALSRVGGACANCHEEMGGPMIFVGQPPEEATERSPRLTHHGWAEARMWEGLALGSDEAWQAGARVLADAKLDAPAAEKAGRVEASLADKVHELAQAAKGAEAHQRRALYAEVLGTCSQCHAKLGVILP